MSIVLTDNQNYSNIAAAVRSKLGSTDTYTPSQMATAIEQTVSPGVFKSVMERTVTAFTVPNSWTSIGAYAFAACVSLASLSFEANSQLTFIGGSALLNCGDLRTVNLPDGITELKDYAFGSAGVDAISLSASLTKIGNSCFVNCPRLASIMLPSSLTIIGSSAFKNTPLTSITIPSGVTSVGANAFASCNLLTTITINQAENSITGAPWGATNATVVWTGGVA